MRCWWWNSRNISCQITLISKDLISYKVRSLDPFQIDECTVGTGAACGAMYLNDGFERLIRAKLGARAEEILNKRTLAVTLRSFETTIKCQFNPLAPISEEFYEVPIPGAPTIRVIGLERGFMTLTKYSSLIRSDMKGRDQFTLYTHFQSNPRIDQRPNRKRTRRTSL